MPISRPTISVLRRLTICAAVGLLFVCSGVTQSTAGPLERALEAKESKPATFQPQFRARPRFKINPSRRVPLAALLEFETAQPVSAVIDVIEGETRTKLSFGEEVRKKHRLPILGLKPLRRYRFVLNLRDEAGRTARVDGGWKFNTPKLPIDFPPIRVVRSRPAKMEPGVTMFNVFQWVNDVANEGLGYIVAVDEAGEVVWFYRADHPISDVKKLRNGNLLYLRQHRVHPWTASVEIDMLGNVVRGWYAGNRVSRREGPRGGIRLDVDTLHHDVVETGDGTFRAITTEVRRLPSFPTSESIRNARHAPANVVGDTIVEFRTDGRIVNRWSLFDLLDTQRIGYGSLSRFWDSRLYQAYASSGGTRDWSHANSLQYLEKSKSMIISSRHQDAIFKIDGATNKIAWILANPQGWRLKWRSLLLKPVGKVEWPYHQHAPKLTSAGTLLVYDNGNYRATPFAPKRPATRNATRVVEYAINERARTVRQIWEYYGDSGQPYYCPLFGDVDLMPKTGNVLITDGGLLTDSANRRTDKIPGDRQRARIVEINRRQRNEKVFEIEIGDKRGGRPTGYMHIGGMRTALFNWLWARHNGGKFVLRIDDTDRERNVDEALEPILQAFRWLGLDWDEGPEVEGPYGPYFQSQRGELYAAAAQRLLDSGHAYRDFDPPELVRQDREAAEKAKRNYVTIRRSLDLSDSQRQQYLEEGRPHVVRFLVPREETMLLDDAVRGHVEWECALMPDPVIQRGDGSPLYNFATVVDDAHMRISHVIRAEEHLSNTPVQMLIHRALGHELPTFAHIPVVCAPGTKEKLSKRDKAVAKYRKNPKFGPMFNLADERFSRIGLGTSETLNPVMVSYYETIGYLPEGVLNMLARLGWSLDDKTEILSLDTVVKSFTLDRVVKSPAGLDRDKLDSFQAHWMGELSVDEKVAGCLPFLQKAGLIGETVDDETRAFVGRLIEKLEDRVRIFSDILDYDEYFVDDGAMAYDEKAFAKRLRKAPESVKLLKAFRTQLADADPFDAANTEKLLQDFVDSAGVGLGQVIHALRVSAVVSDTDVTNTDTVPDKAEEPVETAGNRRTYPRRLSECQVAIHRCQRDAPVRWVEKDWLLHASKTHGFLRDISMSGVSLTVAERFEAGDVLMLRISNPKLGTSVDTAGRVVAELNQRLQHANGFRDRVFHQHDFDHVFPQAGQRFVAACHFALQIPQQLDGLHGIGDRLVAFLQLLVNTQQRFEIAGVLFVGDPKGAAIFAIETGDTKGNPEKASVNVQGIDGKIASLLGTTAKDLLINDVIVNPASGTTYLSVSRGRGPDAKAVICTVSGNGKVSEFSLKNVKYAKVALPNVPAPGGTGRGNRRAQAITDLAFVQGRLLVAGLSNEEFASKLRSLPYPFAEGTNGTSVEIFHGAHGRFETRSPVRTFVPFNIDGKPHVLAAYTCTPLVKFPISQLKPGVKVKGTTIAELGNRNHPLDMIVYKKGGKNYLLLANTSRGVMKISTDGIDKNEGIETKIRGKAGLTYETITQLKGVMQLDRLNEGHALLLVFMMTFTNDQGLRRISMQIVTVTMVLLGVASADQGVAVGAQKASARSNAQKVRLEFHIDTKQPTVGRLEVSGLTDAQIKTVARWKADAAAWQKLLRVFVVDGSTAGTDDQPAMLGSYGVEKGRIVFRPRYSYRPGLKYRAELSVDRLTPGSTRKPVTLTFGLPKPAPTPLATVTQVFPSRSKLPENLLKFYIHFSAPMSRGEAYSRVQLLDAKGKAIEFPFLELGEELWDPSGTRFTLFFDPGRIKRGLKPRELFGPALETGKSYTLVIDRRWNDAKGRSLKATFRKKFKFAFGDDDDFGPFDQRRVVQFEFITNRPVVLDGVGSVHRVGFDQMHQNPGAFDVLEELVPQANAGMRPFNQPGNIGHDELVIEADTYQPEVGILRCERIIGDFGMSPRQSAQQSRLAGVRFSQKTDIGNQFEFERDIPLFARSPRFELPRSPVRGGREVLVASAPFAAVGDNHELSVVGEIFQNMAAIGVANDGSRRHQDDDVFTPFAGAQAAFTMFAPFGAPVLVADDVGHAADVIRRLHDDVSAVTAVPTVRSAARYVGFPPKTETPVSAVARLAVNGNLIDKHCTVLNSIAL
eukprot:g26629.t1